MNNELQQSVVNVVSKPAGVVSVSVATTATGLGAFLEIITPAVGLCAAMAGLMLSILLSYKTYIDLRIRKIELDRLEDSNGE